MYLRLNILRKDEYSHARQGALAAGNLLGDEGDLDSYEYTSLCTSLTWFNKYLRVPAILNEQVCERAISWFKSEARSPIDQMWELVAILQVLGVGFHLFTTDNPGSIDYEDDWQLVAKPHRTDRGRWWRIQRNSADF